MRSRPELHALCLILLLAVSTPVLAAAAQPVTRAEIDHAVEVVKKDPGLASKESVRRLRWATEPEKKQKPPERSNWPEWLGWIGDFFGWIGETSRLLMWVVIGILAALLAFFIVRIFAGQRLTLAPRRFVPPTHVQDLDIRPESLPADIGATARALWDGGKQRAGLALLYRGLLSRLAHVHEVPIRDSSTEGDCLSLAARKLGATHLDYATRLVRTWQQAIYGGLSIDTATVHELCAQFDMHLPQAQGAGELRRPGFASGAGA